MHIWSGAVLIVSGFCGGYFLSMLWAAARLRRQADVCLCGAPQVNGTCSVPGCVASAGRS